MIKEANLSETYVILVKLVSFDAELDADNKGI